MCKNLECEDKPENRCMTKEDCANYITDFKGKTCNDELCNGTDCVSNYKEQPLCEDISCEDQKEGRCIYEEKKL